MKKTISTACILTAVTALMVACSPKSSQNLTTTQLAKRQTWDSHTHFRTIDTDMARCCIRTGSPQQTFQKVLDRNASTITIKDYMK